jgi:hypothetical protein
MKGYNSDYGEQNNDSNNLENGVDYNRAGSSTVGQVESVDIVIDSHNLAQHGIPNSVTQNYKNGHLYTERYYDAAGNAYLDIDYSNHGNSRTHPNVPHEHDIWFDDDGQFHRGKDSGIR